MKKLFALVQVELKKLVRDPMQLAVLVLMPIGLTLVFYFALGNLYQDPVRPQMSHFEYLVPGTMGYAVIYMGMMVALSLCDYREAGLLKRLNTTPTSPAQYLGSLVISNMFIAIVQGLIVLGLSILLGYEAQVTLLVLLVICLFLGILSVVAVGFGLLTSVIAKNAGAASGLSMIFILPMMVFGTFLTVYDEATYNIARFTPNFYVTDTFMRIFYGTPLSEPVIWKNLLILVVIAGVVITAGIQLFKRTEFR
ncbi:MAG: ABC transporter permease [Anaerolineaceae bacterium]|nr:ABC transporter permease [Anaerolineaceae bacterium]